MEVCISCLLGDILHSGEPRVTAEFLALQAQDELGYELPVGGVHPSPVLSGTSKKSP